MTYYAYMPSPVGPLLFAGSETALERMHFSKGSKAQGHDPSWQEAPELFAEAIRQMRAYFAGELREFELALAPRGSEFQQAVWRELLKIPYGETTTYGALAKRLGNPAASRAVGLANGSNPIAIIQPCHRVIGSTGKLTGFGGGIEVKQALLELERGERRLF